MVESRGNLKYGKDDAHQIGVQQVSSSLHFGPSWDQDAYRKTHFKKHNATGYQNDFHKYGFIWNKKGIRFLLDDVEWGHIAVGRGFWV